MHLPYRLLFSFAPPTLAPASQSFRNWARFLSLFLFCMAPLASSPAQTATPRSLVTQAVDTDVVTSLPRHHPNWAVAANRTAQVPDDEMLSQVTLVLRRPDAQQKAFKQFLVDVQNPSSSNYHKWLTPAEVGERFGLSDEDLAAISGWLTSEGLQVDSVSPSRTLVHFSGTAASIGRAFQTSLSYYTIRGTERLSIDSEPTIPLALAPAIQAVRGLSTPAEHPMHSSTTALLAASPDYTSSATTHYLAPADFATIYNVPSTYTGAGVTIGIVGWSRVSTSDLNNYRSMTGSSFPNPTEVIPTAYHGVDPGAACITTSCTSTQLGGQGEATLDVIRAGATAPGASLLLVAAQATSISNDGIGADTEYLVGTSPVPAQIISISFGACEADAGASGVAYWDNLFQTGAAEGISVFVSSGDSAAAGCDDAFTTLPGSIVANSPNYICSSQYATCVGGTQFADTSSPSTYWSSSNNSTTLGSALSYIPEGGWNESSTSSGIAGSGGGVSTVVATPTWQTGIGVPSARAGRYTPDVSFSGAGHDGYLACLAASGSDCSRRISVFSGTSASAPGMAGVAALLDQKLGGGQGNLNPKLYALASNATTYASVFHDATPTSSGVTCNIDVPSRCNSSIYYTTAGAVQEGFALTTGYDQVTGLGSLNVTNFLNAVSTTVAPTVTLTPASTSLTTAQSLAVTIAVTGTSGTPTGSVTVSSGSYTSASATLSSGSASITILAGSLTAGTPTVTATYTPDIASAETYATTSSSAVVVTVSKSTPTVTWATPAAMTYGTALSAMQLNATAEVAGSKVAGSFVYIPAAGDILGVGTSTLQVTFTPTNATNYSGVTQTVLLTVNQATPTITWAAPSAITYGTVLSSTQLNATANTAGSFVYTPAAGAVLGVGTNTLSVTFTPTDTTNYYSSVTKTVSQIVNQATPTITWATPAAITYGTALSATQLNATASMAGSFVYIPAAGTIPGVGTNTLSATFTPTDATNYSGVTQTVLLTVNQATPAITWATPSAITYGTALSSTQLNATANMAGSFVYIPSAGAILGVGTNTLSATFTPTDATNYSSVTQTVLLTVNSATTTTKAPTISSLSPANANAGGSAFTLTVTGANFTSGSAVYWGSTALTTTYVSATQLTASVIASQIASSGIAAISVLGSDGAFSSTLLFEIDSSASTAPTFTTTTVTVTAGSTATYAVMLPSTATIASVTCLNLPAGASCSYSSTTKAVTIATSAATPAGSYPVTIVFTETTTSTTTAGILLPILLLPLLLMRRKFAARAAWFTACLTVILLAGSVFAVGCGGSSKTSTTNTTTTTTQTTSSAIVTLVVK
jgi:subtilase family serine protease